MTELSMAGRILGLRRTKRWSQKELAEKADLSERAVRELELGHWTDPRLSTLRGIADAFQCSMDFIAGRETPP